MTFKTEFFSSNCDPKYLSKNNIFFLFPFNTTKGSKTKVVSFAPDSIGYNGGGPDDSNHGNKIEFLKVV